MPPVLRKDFLQPFLEFIAKNLEFTARSYGAILFTLGSLARVPEHAAMIVQCRPSIIRAVIDLVQRLEDTPELPALPANASAAQRKAREAKEEILYEVSSGVELVLRALSWCVRTLGNNEVSRCVFVCP